MYFGALRPRKRVIGLLGDQRREAAGDEEGRHQAEQDVGRQVGGQITEPALQQAQDSQA